jgi:hypothetical protein
MAYVRTVLAVTVLVAAFLFGSRPVPAYTLDTFTLAPGGTISLATPKVLVVGKRYAFTWAGGGPAQTYTIKQIRDDGWVAVDVAEENINPAYVIPGDFPTRWLNVGLATSIQEMRPYFQ